MRKFNLTAAAFIAAVLPFVGAGCVPAKVAVQNAGQTVDRAANDAIEAAASAPLHAYEQAHKVTEDEQARLNLEAESGADEMTVAMVLTDGATPPAGAQLGDTFGCNDRIAFVKVARESDSGDTLKDVLNSLFAIHDNTVQTYYNGLADSRLSVDKIQSTDGVTTEVWLKGKISSPGECNDPRIKEQIEATVRRLKPKYKIFLNGSWSNYDCIGNLKGDCGQPQPE